MRFFNNLGTRYVHDPVTGYAVSVDSRQAPRRPAHDSRPRNANTDA